MNISQTLNKAMDLMARGKTGMARAQCRKILHHHPDHFDAQHLYGVLCLKEGDYPRAAEQLRRALGARAPDPQKAQASSNLALALLYQGQPDDALLAINSAVELNGPRPEFLSNRASILETLGDWAAMESDLRHVLRTDPDNAQWLTGLAVACRHQQQPEQALAVLAQLSGNSRPSDPDACLEWLLLTALLEGPDAAISLAGDRNDPSELSLYQQTADYCCENGYREFALPFYRRALELDPGNPALQHCLAALEGNTTTAAPEIYIQRLYDQHARAFEQRLVGNLRYQAPWLLSERLQNLGYNSFERILDLGCGTGLVGSQLTGSVSFRQLEGVDLSEGMLQQAARKGHYHQLHHQGAQGFLGAGDSVYQLICAMDMLIYIGSLEQFFTAVGDRLAASGLFALTAELTTEQDYLLSHSGRYLHSLSYLLGLAQQQGLEVIDNQQITLRMERGQPVPGALLILRKQ